MRSVGRTFTVHVVLVQLQFGRTGNAGDVACSGLHHPLAGLVPDHRIHRICHLGCGVLRVGVVDVEPGPVSQDHVGRADFISVDHRHRAGGAAQIETPGIPQRRLDLVVPAGALRAWNPGGSRVGQHRLGGGEDRIGSGIGRRGDSVLDLGTDDPLHTGQPIQRDEESGNPTSPDDDARNARRNPAIRPRRVGS